MSAPPPSPRRGWMPASLHTHEDHLMLAWTLVIAGVIGAVTVGFILVTEKLGHQLHPAGHDGAWRRLLMPIIGSLLAGILLRKFFPNSAGSGIPQTKAALLLNDGKIPLRTAIGKFICSTITLASGVSLGREGPSVQVGAGVASEIGKRLGLDGRRVKALIPAAAAAAVSAAFNTPIAAVLFTLEELVGNLHAPLLGSVVLSAATSWLVMRAMLGDEPLFHVPPYQLVHPVEFLFYGIVGLAGGVLSALFVKLLLRIRIWFSGFPESSKMFHPMAGGLLVGLLAWYVPEILGVGYETVDQALNGKVLLQSMLLLLGLKIIATALCYSSGNAGGIFGPSLFIGAMIGGTVGSVAHFLLPDLTGSVGAYALAGMGAAFAGIIRAPLTSVIMIFEITRDYSIIVPLMISNLASYFLSQRLQPTPVYEALLEQDNVHLPQVRPDTVPRTVRDAMRPAAAATLAENAQVLYPDETLDHALHILATVPSGQGLPVVSRHEPGRAEGLLSVDDILADYRAHGEEPAIVPDRGRALLIGLAVALVALVAGASVIHFILKRDRHQAAEAEYAHGRELSAAGRHDEAIEALRNSLAVLHGHEQRLALARALVQAGRWSEAEVYLEEILSSEPASGPGNLWMGRVENAQHRPEEARRYFSRAVYGDWPSHAITSRRDARWELSSTLTTLGIRDAAAAELSQLLIESNADRDMALRIAQRFFELGEYDRAAAAFELLLKRNAQDSAASAGFGRSLFAAGKYESAIVPLRLAAEQAPDRADLSRELHFAESVTALNPLAPRLPLRARRDRARALTEAVRTAAKNCPGLAAPPAPAGRALEAQLEAATALWKARLEKCPQLTPEEEPLRLLFKTLE